VKLIGRNLILAVAMAQISSASTVAVGADQTPSVASDVTKPQTPAIEVPAEVLAAEANRIATIDNITRPTIAIFDRKGQGGGSGVIISPDGFAVTNYHVTVPCGPAMKVGLSDGRFVDAVLVGLDPGGDIALIKLLDVGPEAYPTAEIGNSDDVRVGDVAYVAGNPFLLADNFKPTISYGIISGVRRYQYPAGTLLEYTDCLQTDAAVNPGNSGGPLFNEAGQLVGINGRCSFEKRGRVNVGVGYAVSINQVERFVSHLKSGRLVDHASLGAVVSTDSDGRVIVDDILEDSDAYRRGLRYGDEIVRFGGRDIATANTLKNVLGTYPEAWRVPIVFRRDGVEYERVVRLAAAHRDGELAAMIEGGGDGLGPKQPDEEQPKRPGGPPQPDSPQPGKAKRVNAAVQKDDALPKAVKDVFETRSGYANYWFNRYHQQRVWNALVGRGDFAGVGWNWTIVGKNDAGGDVEIKLSEDHGSIVLPDGKSEAEFGLSLNETLSPPRSGGLLAALHLWQRLLLTGPNQFGEVRYFGTLPWPDEQRLADCLVGVQAEVETRFYFDPLDGDLVGIEMQANDGDDPCEIYFSEIRAVDGRRMPHRWVIRHGDEQFADIRVAEYQLANAAEKPADGDGDGDGETAKADE
jgi:serine protease Do